MLKSIKTSVARFWKDESGAALMEYSILIGIISAAAVAIAFGARDWVAAQWNDLAADLGSAAQPIDNANDNTGGGTN